MAKDYARTFGQDIMRGEHVVGGAKVSKTEAGAAGDRSDRKGALGTPVHVRDIGFYGRKRAAEASLGRELTTEEFVRDHYTPDGSDPATSSGTSIFDPTLCELVYRWFCPPGGLVLDPFAGGSVRGVVAAVLGRPYVGFELRPEQVAANREQWAAMAAGRAAAPPPEATTDNPDALTPVESRGPYLVKRDDLFAVAGAPGGKARTCLALARAALAAGKAGLVTAGSRSSPQANIVASVGRALGLPVRCHTPEGALSPEVEAARAIGAEIVQHPAGYNTVIVARAREDAAASGRAEVPFGMECAEAVEQTRRQVANLPPGLRRLVVACGSGMSLAGILHGLDDAGRGDVEVVAVRVGADPTARLDAYAPAGWRRRVVIADSGSDYHRPAAATELAGLALDPFYEAKCLPFLEPGDLLWVVGIRATALAAGRGGAVPDAVPADAPAPVWIVGDSAETIPVQPPDLLADLVFSCPPFWNLEVYSDDPDDLSTLGYPAFLEKYRAIIAAACARLRDDRFACFVVGEVRDAKGFYVNLVGDTVRAFQDAGLHYYNEAALVTMVGSLPVRAGKQFVATRKLGRTHQAVLVFLKGDPRRAAAACGPADHGEPEGPWAGDGGPPGDDPAG